MPYNSTPQRRETKARSSVKMRENFERLRNYLDDDHTDIDAAGTHNKVTLNNKDEDPTPTGNDNVLFAKNSERSNASEINIRRTGEPAFDATEWDNNYNSGWLRDACGLLIKWGFAAPTGAASDLPGAQEPALLYSDMVPNAPNFAAVYNVQASVYFNINPADVDQDDWIRIIDFSDPLRLSLYASPRLTEYVIGSNKFVRVSWLAIGS